VVAVWSGGKAFRLAPVPLFALDVALGIREWIAEVPRPSENPYLRISPWRPLWTVALPVAWILLIAAQEARVRRRGRLTERTA
jgi:hypothetical protein